MIEADMMVFAVIFTDLIVDFVTVVVFGYFEERDQVAVVTGSGPRMAMS